MQVATRVSKSMTQASDLACIRVLEVRALVPAMRVVSGLALRGSVLECPNIVRFIVTQVETVI